MSSPNDFTPVERAEVERLAAVLVAERRGTSMSEELDSTVKALATVMHHAYGNLALTVDDFACDARELLDTGSVGQLRETARQLRAVRYVSTAMVLEYAAFAESVNTSKDPR